MSGFYPLKVVDVEPVTREAVMVSLEPNAGDADKFDFDHGQYLTFRKNINGEELRRSYSICSAKGEGVLRVGIKKVADGWFSSWANDDLKPGEVIEAMAPMGRFTLPLDPAAQRSYLGLAVGSGITPILSIIATVLAEEPQARFTLIYGNRSIHSIMFREALDDFKNRYLERLNLIHILKNDGGDIDLFNGRLTREKCEALFDGWVDIGSTDYAFICGPESMTEMASDLLRARGMDDDKIKYELFASSPRQNYDGKAAEEAKAVSDEAIELSVTLDGVTRTIESPKSLSVLDGALDNAMEAPFSCKAGVCSTCRCRVVEGEVEMRANHGLEDYEVEAGYVLSCQSYALTDKVAVDYDQ